MRFARCDRTSRAGEIAGSSCPFPAAQSATGTRDSPRSRNREKPMPPGEPVPGIDNAGPASLRTAALEDRNSLGTSCLASLLDDRVAARAFNRHTGLMTVAVSIHMIPVSISVAAVQPVAV